jgi:SWI/SNF-related matrix-associated actin-dependent regulator 1 of chromatin subfamily A
LVVVPASVKYNWFEKWAEIVGPHRSISVIESAETAKRKRNWDTDVVVINYDILGKKQGKGSTVKFPELLSTPWKMFIFDEGHFLKDDGSQRAKVARMMTKKSKAIIQLLTGTPTMSRPSELWNLLVLIKKSHLIAESKEKFQQRYCGAYRTKYGLDASGATNILELNKVLRENCYLRREKRDVLLDLPDVETIILKTPSTNLKEIQMATENLYEYLLETKGEEAADRAMEAQALVALGVLRKLSIQGKLKAIEQYLNDWKASGIKLVIFGLHREELDYLSEKFKCKLIAGGISSKVKQEIVKDWQVNSDVFLFANITSAGTGVDGLQNVCSNMLILELPWRPSDLTQVVGRLDRSGQKNATTVSYMLNDDSIDKQMWEMLQEKEINTEGVNKGVDLTKEESGMRMVLKKIIKIIQEKKL